MKVVYTEQSLNSLEELLIFLMEDLGLSLDKTSEVKAKILDMADSLINHPYKGQFEEYLEHLGKGHRRLIEGYTKIIYLVKEDCIYITDFFDTRQDPAKMKG